MARPKNAKNYSHMARVAFADAIAQRFKGKSQKEAWSAAWQEVMENEGMAKALQLLSHFVPAEMHVESEKDVSIPVIGVVPADSDAWNQQFEAKPAITVDNESGEVVSH